MSRKPLAASKRSSKAPEFNTLLKELENPRTLVSFLPEDCKIAALSVPEHYLGHDEETLVKIIEDIGAKITNTLEALRSNFWLEYDRVQASRTENQMNLQNVHQGVCTRTYWHKITMENPYLFAYILTRPPEYEATMAGLLSLSTRRIRDILSIPLKENGKLQDPKILDLILKAAAMVDLRNKGSVVQRSETKNLTLMQQSVKHVHTMLADDPDAKTAAQIEAEMDAKIKLLDQTFSAPAFGPTQQAALPATVKEETVEAEYKEVGEGSAD